MSKPVFNYTSGCCNVRADKEPCVRKLENKKQGKSSESTLGTWRCSKCGCPCRCTRTKAS